MRFLTKFASISTLAAMTLGLAPGNAVAAPLGFRPTISDTSCPGQKKVCHTVNGKLVCTCDGPISG